MMNTYEEYASYREEYSLMNELMDVVELSQANIMFAWTEELEETL